MAENIADKLPEVVVSSTPLTSSVFESVQPVTVLSGSELRQQASGNIGQALAGQPGISQSYFGPGASRPVIRGLGGDRVRILENGTGSQDVSNTSPDHAVTVDPALVNKIEVVRGPAALMYGTTAVGGAVNIFDNRIPESLPEAPASGTAEVRGGTVNGERAGIASITAPAGNFAFHVDALKRSTSDFQIPGFARSVALRNTGEQLPYPEPHSKVPFSNTDTENATVGGSYITEGGFFGASLNDYSTNYGVPNGENDVSIDAHRTRIDIRGKKYDPIEILKSAELKIGIVDYNHTEFEGAEPGTKFKNHGFDGRLELTHKKIGPMEGLLGFQMQTSKFSALGEEAFQPPTEQFVGSAFLFEEYKALSNLTFQAGGRVDFQNTDAHGFTPFKALDIQDISRNFTTFSQSGGVVWNPLDQYALALSLSHTERAPSGQELFADGPHVATGAFEVGDPTLDPERSVGVDLSLKKNTGRITGSIGGFYNRFSNYINLDPTGKMQDNLPSYTFNAIAADFVGFESQLAYHVLGDAGQPEDFWFDFQPDYVRGTNKTSNDPLPRITPLRMKFGATYKKTQLFESRLELQKVFNQDRVSEFETTTPGYTFLNMYLTREIKVAGASCELFLRGTNLLNQKAREHVSFIKDVTPLPGINIAGGIRFVF